MSLNNQYTTKWADGDYTFALNLAQIEELQRLCSTEKDRSGNAKPDPFGRIFSRVLSGDFYPRDIHETIRLGLIGGGAPATRAKELLETYVVGKPFNASDTTDSAYAVAVRILSAAMNGIEPSEDKKPQGEGETTKAPDS